MHYSQTLYNRVFAKWHRLQGCWSIERVHKNVKVYIAACCFAQDISYMHVGLLANKSKTRPMFVLMNELCSREEKPHPDQDSALILTPLQAHYHSGISSLTFLLIPSLHPLCSPAFNGL